MPLYRATGSNLTNLVAADGSTGGFIKDSQAGSLPATATNDSATTGTLGQYLENEVLQANAVSLTSVTNLDVCTVSLTAGDWEAWGNLGFVTAAGTTITNIQGWISDVSVTTPTPPNKGAYALFESMTTGADYLLPIGRRRFSVAATTSIYLTARSNFGTSTMTVYGMLCARRAR